MVILIDWLVIGVGEFVGIVGCVGLGKSMFFKLLVWFVDFIGGNVKIDGIDLC